MEFNIIVFVYLLFYFQFVPSAMILQLCIAKTVKCTFAMGALLRFYFLFMFYNFIVLFINVENFLFLLFFYMFRFTKRHWAVTLEPAWSCPLTHCCQSSFSTAMSRVMARNSLCAFVKFAKSLAALNVPFPFTDHTMLSKYSRRLTNCHFLFLKIILKKRKIFVLETRFLDQLVLILILMFNSIEPRIYLTVVTR